MSERLLELKEEHNTPDKAKELFKNAKETISAEKITHLDTAINFYIINKCSFSGLTESSSFSPQASESNFSFRGIEKLAEYSKLIENWNITNLDWKELMSDNRNSFIYLDPPYEIGNNLYGKKGDMHKHFNHDDFATVCDEFTAPQLISYNSSQVIRNRFKNWNAAEFDHTYTMRSVGDYMKDQQDRKELLLLNYGT